LTEHPERVLARRPSGGFRLESGEGVIEAVPVQGGRCLEGDKALRGCRLERLDEPAGFVLLKADGEECGRTQRLPGIGRDASLRYLQLVDGRLFRILLRGTRQTRFELLGWETPGAYLVAHPEAAGRWRVSPCAAAAGLGETAVLSVLFAAEMLDMEESAETDPADVSGGS
jgi:hypothetical protein